MFGLIKKIFIGLLTGLVNGSNYRKCASLSNKKCKNARNEDSHEFEYYPFSVKLDRFAGSCNTINDLSNQLCITNKTEDLNLSVFSMITGINESKILTKHISCESKTLTKHISCECKCRFDGKNVIQVNGGITINIDVSIKTFMYVKKTMFGILLYIILEIAKYLASIMDGIICNEIIDAKETNFNETNITCETQNFYILLTFLLIPLHY